MNADLERTLDELGPAYRGVVARLRGARELVPTARVGACAASPLVPAPGKAGLVHGEGTVFWRLGWLAAASLFAAIVLAFVIEGMSTHDDSPDSFRVYTVAYAASEEALELIVASQRADGSWDNDYITRQNAAALRRGESAAARVAYRKAVRYLRSRGLAPLSEAELRERGESAARALANS